MHRLRLTVPFHTDEPPMSFVSRLALRNGAGARTFCRDFGMRFQHVVDGEAQTLRRIAEMAGIDPTPLLANAFVKSGRLQWTFRGQALHRTALRRERIAICPACVLDDIKAAPALRPPVAAHGRAIWLLDVVRTCPSHRQPLVTVSKDLQSGYLHDFAHHFAAALPRLAERAAAARRDPGPLETYAIGRLDGRAASPLLDAMPLAAAARLCETAGAVALFGPKVDLKRLSGEDRHAAGGAGFDAIASGPGAFRSFLDGLMAEVDPRARLDGPGVAFGRLFTLLRITRSEPEFDAVREVARDYIMENFALPYGHNLLGKPVGSRRIHTIHTLSKEKAVHPKTLRKHLRAAGLLSDAQMSMSDHNVRIDADKAIEIAAQLGGTLSLAEAMEHLNAPRAQMGVLIEAGFVKPQRQVTGFGAQDRYAVADLEALLARLRRKIRPVGRKRLDNIPDAARKACCSAAEIVRLIIDGRIRTARGQAAGYLGILVDPRDVAKAVRGPKNDGLPLRKVAALIGTHDGVVASLIAGGHLLSYRGVNAVNRCPQTLVAPKEIKKFKASYVSLHALAKRRKVFIGTVKHILEAAGIAPAFDPKEVGASFYYRKDVGN